MFSSSCIALVATLMVADGTGSASQNAPPSPAERVAAEMAVGRRYVTAMMANDHDTQGKMLAPDAVFEDPTTTITGRDGILAAWTKQRIKLLGFDEQYAYHSGLTGVVFGGTTKFEQTFATPDGKSVTMSFAVRTTLAVTVRGDQITRHIDYVDIGAFNAQLQAHIKRLRDGGGGRQPEASPAGTAGVRVTATVPQPPTDRARN